ncbi:MAG: hypothetical protein WCF01_10555 [Nitrososphaeraceae archaeon]
MKGTKFILLQAKSPPSSICFMIQSPNVPEPTTVGEEIIPIIPRGLCSFNRLRKNGQLYLIGPRWYFSLFRLGITTSDRESYGWKNSETSSTEVSKPGCHKAQGN